MRKILLLTLCFLLVSQVYGQDYINLRRKTVYLPADSIRLDTLSIVPGSLVIRLSDDWPVPDSLYRIDPHKSLFYPSPWLNRNYDSVLLSFRVFPFSWLKPYQHKKPGFNSIDPGQGRPRLIYSPAGSADPFAGTDLVSNGNISRGLMVGNTRDPSLSSNLSLQLNGKINKDFMIEANLSDANIPVQPEGNTQQIQDFDRLYLRVYNPRNEILGGDFELKSPGGYFLRMNKKVQGAKVTSRILENKTKGSTLTSSISGAVVKGKYTQNKIAGQEGNQGPYRLTGHNGESYIQVIAGSEKVYIDGVILSRGEQNDYVIDYNTAELRFTPKNLITKDKRIRVEFEYTEQSYARFLMSSSTEWKREKGSWYAHLFSEQDAKNQPLLQDLSDIQKNLMGQIGDNSSLAVVPNYFPAEYRNDRVLYKLTDTLVNGTRYDSVLVYTYHPDSARYQAGFSFAGENSGDYVPVTSAANGQVYQWVAPQDGVPQGSYAPYTRLVSPVSKQIIVLGGEEQLTTKMGVSVEMSMTRNDLNTFSDKDDSDNIGFGLNSRLFRVDALKPDSSWLLSSSVEFRRTGASFDPLERFRSVEFERDWNLDQATLDGDENFVKTNISLTGKDSVRAGYQFEYLSFSGPYQACRHISQGGIFRRGWSVSWDGSYMSSSSEFRNTSFGRHNIQLSKSFRQFRLFVLENHEGNLWSGSEMEFASSGSFKFQEWKFGIESAGKNKVPWFFHFMNRNDHLPGTDNLVLDSRARQFESGLDFRGRKGRRTALSLNWRDLESLRDSSMEEKGGQSLTARLDENFQLGRGALVSRTFYEIGSGLERKMEYSYLQVAPGQGYYTWTDYNQNGNQELDEFEPAYFRDQADFIRIFRPGTTYIPTYLNRFNQVLTFQPGRFFKQDTGAGKVFSRISNSLAFRVNKKSYRTRIGDQLNPFTNLQDDSLTVSNSSQFRNTLSFNKTNPVFGVDYHFEMNRGNTLLSYGTDKRSSRLNRIVVRARPLEVLWITNLSEKGSKTYSSTFFTGKNYQIDYLKNDIDLTLKAGERWQTGLSHEWRKESNLGQAEKISAHRLEGKMAYQMPAKGQIQMDLSYLAIQFTGDPNSPVGYVMLQGFRPGHNGLLSLSVRRKLNKVIQLDFRYEGRMAQGSSIVHTGSVQVRAVF